MNVFRALLSKSLRWEWGGAWGAGGDLVSSWRKEIYNHLPGRGVDVLSENSDIFPVFQCFRFARPSLLKRGGFNQRSGL